MADTPGKPPTSSTRAVSMDDLLDAIRQYVEQNLPGYVAVTMTVTLTNGDVITHPVPPPRSDRR